MKPKKHTVAAEFFALKIKFPYNTHIQVINDLLHAYSEASRFVASFSSRAHRGVPSTIIGRVCGRAVTTIRVPANSKNVFFSPDDSASPRFRVAHITTYRLPRAAGRSQRGDIKRRATVAAEKQ